MGVEGPRRTGDSVSETYLDGRRKRLDVGSSNYDSFNVLSRLPKMKFKY